MPVDPHAALDVLRAWTQPGQRPDVHASAQRRLRQDWSALAMALDRLAAGAGGALLSTREVQEITDRYRVSPWDAPPTRMHPGGKWDTSG